MFETLGWRYRNESVRVVQCVRSVSSSVKEVVFSGLTRATAAVFPEEVKHKERKAENRNPR